MATTADQLPGCSIPDKCMLHPDQGLARRDAFCENNLKCMCKVDNRLGNNSVFSSECLLKECTDGHDRKLFLKDWLESCRQVGESGWDDMPWEWEPYLPNEGEVLVGPTTYLNAPPATSSLEQSSILVVTKTAAVATSLPLSSLTTLIATSLIATSPIPSSTFVETSVSLSTTDTTSSTPAATETGPVVVHSLSGGVIGGIVAGILLLVFICAGLGYFYWKANKKAKEKNREVAILSDQVSGCGFQRRIDELLAESNGSTGTILRHSPPVRAEMGAHSSSTVGVTSASSSVYSVDIARAL